MATPAWTRAAWRSRSRLLRSSTSRSTWTAAPSFEFSSRLSSSRVSSTTSSVALLSVKNNDCSSRLAPAAAAWLADNTDKRGAEYSRTGVGKFGIFSLIGGVVASALGVRLLGEEDDIILCDAAELEKADPALKSPVIADKQYSLLADSYRRQVFFNYERRIRLRSRPEKVFAYFASHRDPKGQPYMTPSDLMRAVVPVFPPTDSVFVREGHLEGERSPGELSCEPSKFFMLFDTNNDGLISFAEYIFFVTLLSIPDQYFKAAFKMYDLNGDGHIDRDEFQELMRRLKERTRQGLAQQDVLNATLDPSSSIETGGLVEYFFGKDGKTPLRHEDFENFLRDLHIEMTRLEFAHYDFKQKGNISAYEFGLSMIASADMDRLAEYLDRANSLPTDPHFKDVRISSEEFHRFAELRKKLRKLALAMSSYGALNREDFQRAASQVCNIPLSNSVVDVIFHIFDTNQDGQLSSEEFLHVMERRESDVANPKDTGLVSMIKCWWSCAKNCKSSTLKDGWRV